MPKPTDKKDNLSMYLLLLDSLYCKEIKRGFDLSKLKEYIINKDYPFCFSLDFSPEWISEICYNGYLPMAENLKSYFFDFDERCVILLIKYHERRAVLDLNKQIVHSSTKRYAKNLKLTIDKDYWGCVRGIWENHGENWLYEELATAFEKLYKNDSYKARVHSVELWDTVSGELVAGEIGYRVGGLYTSLSGFKKRKGAGSVQLSILGRLLKGCGIDYWDLGMVMSYKLDMGADILDRDHFFEIVKKYRDNKSDISCDGVTMKGLS